MSQNILKCKNRRNVHEYAVANAVYLRALR